MLIIFRVLLGAAMVYGVVQIAANVRGRLPTGEPINVFWVGYCLLLGILNVAIWTPSIKRIISRPSQTKLTKCTLDEEWNLLVNVKPDQPGIRVVSKAPPPLPRDFRIRLFDGADSETAKPEPTSSNEGPPDTQ